MFPNGVEQYIVGGLLIGLGSVLVYLFRGSPVGASTAFIAVCSYVSELPFVREPKLLAMRSSRLLFSLGFVLGAALLALLGGYVYETGVSTWRLVVGGFLVGFGTRMGRGCTAGHGVCGLGSRSWQSAVAVLIFVSVAVVTAQVLAWLGVGL